MKETEEIDFSKYPDAVKCGVCDHYLTLGERCRNDIVEEGNTLFHRACLKGAKAYLKKRQGEGYQIDLQTIIEMAQEFECCPDCGNTEFPDTVHYCPKCMTRISTPEDAVWFAKYLENKFKNIPHCPQCNKKMRLKGTEDGLKAYGCDDCDIIDWFCGKCGMEKSLCSCKEAE